MREVLRQYEGHGIDKNREQNTGNSSGHFPKTDHDEVTPFLYWLLHKCSPRLRQSPRRTEVCEMRLQLLHYCPHQVDEVHSKTEVSSRTSKSSRPGSLTRY